MTTDPAYPSPRDKDKEPSLGFTKLEEASLRIFCAMVSNPAITGDPAVAIGSAIQSAKTLLAKVKAADI